MSLKGYQKKRDFRKSPEPKGSGKKSEGRLYVVQKHEAGRLHYDFRLEHDGVLLSWAIPKGPSLDPDEKRLAVRVEDHPIEYGDFEGLIPQGQYGGGTVMIWDHGQWEPQEDAQQGLKNGKLKFTIDGDKLHGGFTLVRMGRKGDDDKDNWLLIKEDDKRARSQKKYDVLKKQPDSAETGRSLREISEDDDAEWSNGKKKSNNGRDTNRSKHTQPGDLTKADKKAFPKTPSPQLATLVDEIPRGDQWEHEVKFDGYRLLASIKNGQVKLITRHGKDWSSKFPPIVKALQKFPVENAVIDGEVVVQKKDGTQDFQALQNYMKRGDRVNLVFYVFDLLYCAGYDLTPSPLRQRKKLLGELMNQLPEDGPIRFSDGLSGSEKDIYRHACRLGLEGIISKRRDRPYQEKRTRSWVKTKCEHRQEFVIGGYTEPRGTRVGFGALLLGYYQNDDFVYAGKVGTGFDQDTLKDLHRRLSRHERKTPPYADPPTGNEAKGAHWVTPKWVAEIRFTEWTSDGMLRHPTFMGLRTDKEPEQVVREKPKKQQGQGHPEKSGGEVIAGVRLTHPEKVLYKDQGLTKHDLAAFYEEIADWILPHVAGRPLTVVRCPEGHDGQCFYQKHVGDNLPEAIEGVRIKEKNSQATYIVIENIAGLIGLAQMGVLEIHPWGSRADDPDKPDRLVFDLDPGPDVDWSAIVRGARLMRDRLESLGLVGYVKTSGGKGLHVVVPITRRSSWDQAKDFAHALADAVVRDDPDHYIATMSKSKRKGKIFIDYLRNARGATSVAAYSTRARSGATVSTPLRWDELSESTDPAGYRVENLPRRLASLKGDPWDGFFEVRQSITRKMQDAIKNNGQ